MVMLQNLDRVGVSVVICCYNSESRIIPTLEHLRLQSGITFPWEILLVDNHSTDNTPQVALENWASKEHPCELRVITEQRKGTMFARLTGIQQAGFRYLLFCDDDNWLSAGYVKTAYDIISADGTIAAVGGLGELETEAAHGIPTWSSHFSKSFGAGPQGKVDGDTTHDKGCLYTAGAILDRNWLNLLYSLGFESSLKGRDGKSLVAGEDTELTYALKLIGGRLYYSSAMHFKHFMPAGRLKWTYLKKLWRSFGYADFLLSPYKMKMTRIRDKSVLQSLLIQGFLLLKFGVLAMTGLFRVGDSNVLKFQRAMGEVSAALSDPIVFRRNKAMAEKLISNNKRNS